jgi:hypothetical protein
MNTTAATLPTTYATREEWLIAATPILTDWLRGSGAPVFAAPLVSVGFPSKRALCAKKRAIGQCWTIPGERNSHIFISPTICDVLEVLAVLLHELIHAAVPNAGHKGPFRTIAKAVGLTGKMTSTVASEDLRLQLRHLADELGAYPHRVLDPKEVEKALPKQGTRMLKIECRACGYTCRASAKWIEKGTPTCCCGAKMVAEEAGETEGEE